ncbi:alpha/beta hydrolase [Petrotoga sp. 9PW.55.5.1]|uniref:alpha/beta hydrolase n=1 Tax=Petrotoga sp. 9PW.55.5.1 TaxID=1308979 RepID=UPI001F44C0E5|nr:alpha/beta hydrolase [Petrotoga sp. 9PW.55.5.1]
MKKIIKILGLLILFIMMFWNFLVAAFFIILFNIKSLKKSVFGNLPLETKKNSYKGPITIEYKKANLPLKLDIYYPSKPKNKYPVVFFAHGGGWVTGSRKLSSVTSWAKYLSGKGFAVVAIDYRYGYFYKFEDLIEDYSSALNYIRENYHNLNIDKDKIVLMGTSAGGTLSLYYAAYHSYFNHTKELEGIKGVVAWYSPTDLLDLWNIQVDSLFAQFAVTTTMKGTPKNKYEDYKAFSPINYISERMLPTMLIHGEKDSTVPLNSSVKFYEELKKQGVNSVLLTHPKGEHSFELELKDLLTQRLVEKTVNFIRERVENLPNYAFHKNRN